MDMYVAVMSLGLTLSLTNSYISIHFQRKRSSSTESESDKERSDLDEGDVHALPPVYFISKKKGLGTEEAAKLLLGRLTEERVATFKPFTVSSNSVYVFQRDRFSNIHDVLTDGCSIWIGTGTKAIYATKRNDGSIELVPNRHEATKDSYTIERRFYTHSEYKDVKRNFILIKGKLHCCTYFVNASYFGTSCFAFQISHKCH